MNHIAGSKLISVLSAFTRSEWRDFRAFLISGIAGPIGKTVLLYDCLSEHYPDFHAASLERQGIFTAIYGNQAFDDKKLRYALTDLYRQAGSFLKFKALESHHDEGTFLLASFLAQRGADKAYLSLYNSDGIAANGDATEKPERYFHKYRQAFVHMSHYLSRQQRNESNPIGEVAHNLDIFYIAKKLQLLCEIINVRNVMAVNYDFLLQDKVVELAAGENFNDVPVIKIYYRILMTLTEPEQVIHFENLKTLIAGHGNLFIRDERRDLYQYLMNYCIKKINQGIPEYVQTLFEIYKTIIENKVIYSGNHLSQWDFKNIVVIGIRAGESQWVLDFIENRKADLPVSEQDNAYTYNLAYYWFSAGDFRRSLSLLRQVEFTDLYYQLDMRAILLKCYYEMDDQEALFYHAAAFRIFITRNKTVSDYQRVTYRNLIRFITRLVRLNGHQQKLQQLQNEIETIKQIADINWLRKKVTIVLSDK